MAILNKVLGTASQFYQPAQQAFSALHVKPAYVAFRADPSLRTAWPVGGHLVGVLGYERVINALIKYSLKLVIKTSLLDSRIGEEMVDEMKGSVPVDQGNLLNGITMEKSGDLITVMASAIHGEDYARFVEFGTGDNGKVADDSFFADGTDAGVALHTSGSGHHASTPPEPYFWPAARNGLEKHRQGMSSASNESKSESGL